MSYEHHTDIRLGCIYCDRDDFDGISESVLSHVESMGWQDVGPADQTASILDWETHLGTCPDCAHAERMRMLNHPNHEVREYWRTQEPTR